jgi:arginyl-tRNA synthetase
MLPDTTLEQQLGAWVEQAIRALFPGVELGDAIISVAPAADESFGDYSSNAAMALARVLKKAPREIAQAVASRTDLPESVETMDVAGPGFLNFHLRLSWLADHLARVYADERLGVPRIGTGRTVVMDYGSPNITKPLHIGHLRSHNIGSALDRLHRFLGFKVIADNHLGDWGTQFGITIMGYRHFGDAAAMEQYPLEELERVYVLSYEKSRADESWLAQCRRELVKLQAGDPENRALWRRFVQLSLAELERTYQRLGVSYDLVRGESHYNDKLEPVVKLLESQGLARESEGATVVFLEEEKLPVCIVRKSDGGFNYATSDIATVLSRIEEFKPDEIIYVTDERQQLHFKQFFAIARRLGIKTRLVHVWFGLMRLPEATFSTREGNVIKLDKLLDEAETRALAIVQKSSPEMDPARQREIARAVGIGAVKYADLSSNPQSLVTFTWEKALALDGNSAPYLQYAHARIASVQDKYAERFPGVDPDVFPMVIGDPIERRLAVKLVRFPMVVMEAAKSFRPNALCDYLYELSQVYSTFYQNVPFLKAEEGIRESRVRLCNLVAKTLRQGLALLGIETPNRI